MLTRKLQQILGDMRARKASSVRRRKSSLSLKLESMEARCLLTYTIVNTTFNTLPSNVSLLGNAYLNQPLASEVVLTQNATNKLGTLIVSSHGMAARDFSASASVYLGNDDRGADGMSFGYGDLSGNAFGVNGEWNRSGVWFIFDTYRAMAGGGLEDRNAAIDIYNNGVLLRTHNFPGNGHSSSGIAGRGYYTFSWGVSSSGLVTYTHPALGTRTLQLGTWNPLRAWRFGIGAQTGASIDEHSLHDFSIIDNSAHAPTDISLSATSFAENVAVGTTVATISTTDPDVSGGSGDTFSYSLVSGSGSTDNGSFSISGNTLRTNAAFNYEAKTSYSVRLRTTDQNGHTYEEPFTISVTNVNETPTDVTLSNATIAENQPISTTVGTLATVDPDGGGTFTYQLVPGTGGTDNSQFEIVNGVLKTKSVFDYETQSIYSIRVRSTDSGGLSFERPFTIYGTDIDEIVPTVSAANFVASGTLPANARSLSVTFSETVVGANVSSSYDLRRAGPDGLLGNSDDLIINIASSDFSGHTATLNFPALTEDVYRLTVKDAITDGAGNGLDGDKNGTAGGNWRKDFVVGVLTASLTSRNGFAFDADIDGFGAGQLIQGPENSFDGVNSLSVAGQRFSAAQTTPVSYEEVAATPTNFLTTSWADVAGLTATVQLENSAFVRLSTLLALSDNSQSGAWTGEVRFSVNGVEQSTAAYIGTPFGFTAAGSSIGNTTTALSSPNTHNHGVSLSSLPGDRYVTSPAEDWITLPAGSHTINVQIRKVSGTPTPRFAANSSQSLRILSAVVPIKTADQGRTVITEQESIANFTVSREVTTPSLGSHDFARTVDVFSNDTGSVITVPVRIVGNLGSDANTVVFATSDGDTIVEPTDLWFGTDDGDGSGTPAIIHLLHGPYGLQPTSVNVIEDNVEWTYDLTVPAGETKRLANFTVLGTTRAEAIAAANALVTTNGFGGEAAAFLTSDELSSLANFQFNSAPTDLAISNNLIAENAGSNAIVGTLSFTDPNAGETGVFSLPSGIGDNGLFNIAPDGITLRASGSFNFEALNAYSVTVRVTDAGGLSFEKTLSIDVTNVNEAPTDISLSATTVAENLPGGTVVGTFSTGDPDAGNTFTYALVAIPGNSDDASFMIEGNTLQTSASFNFEVKPSYSIRVRSTDAGGLSFEKVLTIAVTNVEEDVTAPVSAIGVLPASSGSLVIPISVAGSDPGAGASGVQEYDLYYSTGGLFIKFATVPVSSPSTTFTGSANTTYWFRSLARDHAGNVESKISADTYTRIGDVVPPVTQVISATPNSSGLFTIEMTGSKASGSALTQFDVYVSVDSSPAVLIGTATGGTPTAGVYSGTVVFQGLADGSGHTYRFYSIGRDGSGNLEAAPVSGDVSETYSFSPVAFSASGIDVQNGANQRSYVRYLDVLFSSAAELTAWPAGSRMAVERFAIDAASVTPGSGTVVTGFGLTKDGSKLKLDFGSDGLGGLRQAGNGFYRVRLDLNGNSSFDDVVDQAFEFHRLFGDANGDGRVDVADTNLVTSQVGRRGTNLDGDLDGNGIVNTTDRLYSTQQRGKQLLDPLLGWLDD